MKNKFSLVQRCFLLLLTMLGLAACGTSQGQLTLAEGKPTLLFFYTEN